MVARLFGQTAADRARERRRGARPARSRRAGRPPRAHLLGRHAPPARPRRQPGRRAPAAAARRADDRARPAQPDRALGRDPGARRGGHRRAADHPVPRRGRPARRPHRDRRPRPGRSPTARRPSSSARSAATSSRCTPSAATSSPRWPRPRPPRPRRARRSTRPPAGSPSASTSRGDGLQGGRSRALDAAGLEIDDIALRQPTLDEVFLALTGAPRPTTTADSPRAEAAAA